MREIPRIEKPEEERFNRVPTLGVCSTIHVFNEQNKQILLKFCDFSFEQKVVIIGYKLYLNVQVKDL